MIIYVTLCSNDNMLPNSLALPSWGQALALLTCEATGEMQSPLVIYLLALENRHSHNKSSNYSVVST